MYHRTVHGKAGSAEQQAIASTAAMSAVTTLSDFLPNGQCEFELWYEPM